MKIDGYAVIRDGSLDLRTVSTNRVDTIVRYLTAARLFRFALPMHDPLYVEIVWLKLKGDAEIAEIAVSSVSRTCQPRSRRQHLP